MLKVNGISYRYQNNGPWVFRNFRLAVQPGEIVGLCGYNGAGKTTLAKIIAGYLKPHEGEILVDEQPVSSFTGIRPVQLVWQHPEKSINPKWKMKKVLEETTDLDEELLSLLGIKSEWLDRWPSELSGGELQRFCLARTLGKHTKYLIADEMTTMLDAVTQAQIWHALLELAKQRNIGILAISHNQHLLQKISDRTVSIA
ncbi:ATP-binding cassette domain-containing protein [Thermoactinomyces sp. AMNI-1]|uniref:ATP-binding cassette domain-containing protein n=2 Tax=Thermoactinomyces mirandus TaxID=2756294 RepID=A0A7W2ARX5_9BACL|nr:ATP-binding cassette domain-containing protein [Thermoactinomyces mirandus]